MPDRVCSSRKSPFLLVATAAFSVPVIPRVFNANWRFALSQADFAATIGLLYAGAEERGGASKVGLWVFLGVAVMEVILAW